MSELIKSHDNRATIRWKLLTGASALVLAAYVSSAFMAKAEDAGQPQLWIELGGQLNRLDNAEDPFAPPFVSAVLQNPFTPPAEVQAPPRYGFEEDARVTFNPEDTNWEFTAAIRYGRANSHRTAHEETAPASGKLIISIPFAYKYETSYIHPLARRFATTDAQLHENHLILDFEVGRDVGLGFLGPASSSTFNVGVRFAQFDSRARARLDADPNFTFDYNIITRFRGHAVYIKLPDQRWNTFAAQMSASRSFHGVGPSLEWTGDAILGGRKESGALLLDWGVNGALLFGRQRMKAHHQTSAHYRSDFHPSSYPLPLAYQITHDAARSRTVVVPNAGGFAGLSYRYANARVSIGYRGDFFFNAIDGGIDTRKDENRAFFGPFASISIGLGD